MVVLSMLICIIFMGGYALFALLLSLVGLALNLVMGFLTVCSLLLLVLFLVLLVLWRRSGRADRAYISQFTGWKRLALSAVSWSLMALTIWEALALALGILYFVFRPALF